MKPVVPVVFLWDDYILDIMERTQSLECQPLWREVVFSSVQLPQNDGSAHLPATGNESVRVWNG